MSHVGGLCVSDQTGLRGFAKEKIQKIRVYYGSGWVGPGFTRNLFVENHPKIALNQY